MGKVLIAYFSRAGQNYASGKIVNLAQGNTEAAAEMIQQMVGGDLFHIEASHAYSDDYRECVKQSKEEYSTKARPQLLNQLDSIEEYDTIYLGYPNWCGTCPMPVFTFLESYDFTGKKIKPFCTNEGSGLAGSIGDIEKSCKGGIIGLGLSLKGSMVKDSKELIKNWI